jgi:hypothetical protein
MRRAIAGTALMLAMLGCASVPPEQPYTREEVAARVDCAKLPAGTDCNCVIDKTLAGAPNAPLTVLNETPQNAAQSQAIARQIRIGIARMDAEKACAKPAGAN